MEMRTSLAKIILNFDIELADNEVDWLRDSRMQTLWKKPPLKIRASLAK
jgi:cytochrome P450